MRSTIKKIEHYLFGGVEARGSWHGHLLKLGIFPKHPEAPKSRNSTLSAENRKDGQISQSPQEKSASELWSTIEETKKVENLEVRKW